MAYASISKPSLHFNTKLFTGNGGTQSITGVGFQPDMVLTTSRSNGYNNGLFDAVRGTQKQIITNGTDVETTLTTGLNSFDSDGFTFNGASYNTNTYTFVAWNWKAGGGAGSANTDGTINTTSTSVNTTAGFSISKYTGNETVGATVGHGLGAVPKVIMIKKLSQTDDWFCYFESVGATKKISLNTTAAPASASSYWNNTAPTSSVFTLGNNGANNANGQTHIAYCFAEKKGYSKFGSYTGNGNNDGTFVYTGFKPSFVLIKRTDSTTNWQLIDNKRSNQGGFNIIDEVLAPNVTDAEYDDGSNWFADFLSNGFKLRNGGGAANNSGSPHLYMAFAAEPLVANVGNSIPATAR